VTSRKKPTAGFWITVALAAVLVGYPLSFGPACRLANRNVISPDVIRMGYKPILRVMDEGPLPMRRVIARYAGFSDGQITDLQLSLECVHRE
jgi:hypothetical protein